MMRNFLDNFKDTAHIMSTHSKVSMPALLNDADLNPVFGRHRHEISRHLEAWQPCQSARRIDGYPPEYRSRSAIESYNWRKAIGCIIKL